MPGTYGSGTYGGSNAASITRLRGAMFLYFTDVGYVLELSGSSDSGGGEVQAWGTAGTFDCRVDALAGGESVTGNRLSDRSTHLISLPPNSTVDHNDRFKVNGDTYEITAVRNRTDEFHRELEAAQVS